jgi:hypothetical protein
MHAYRIAGLGFVLITLTILLVTPALLAISTSLVSLPVSLLSQEGSVDESGSTLGALKQTLQGSATGPLFVNPNNPRYFTDGVVFNGKYRAVYLTGSHTWCNFMDCDDANPIIATFNYTAYLDFLVAKNHNFFRMWRAENARGGEAGDDFWFDPMPYQRSTICCAFDNNNKFDLSQFNQAYFDRLRMRVIEAGNRGIYVSIMLFDGWSVENKGAASHQPWKGHPFNLSNNVNNFNGDLNNDGQGGETHTLANPQVTALQEAYVQKVIDAVNDLDNVLYEISNESTGGTANLEWQSVMINYIKTYEASKPKQHPVGMTIPWPNGSNTDLYNSPADWVSLNGDLDNPPVAASTKVILADTDHLCGICGSRQWVWKSFTRGENPIFMDIYDNATTGRGVPFLNPNEVEIRNSLGYANSYAKRVNLVEMLPRPDLCSTGYCLANPAVTGAEYLVYLPSGGNVTVNLSVAAGQLSYEWFNPANGTIAGTGTVMGGGSRSFNTPFSGDAVLYIYAPVVVTATSTNTPIPPTATLTRTNTPPPPTATRTNTVQAPTSTRTNTPPGPTASRTSTSTFPPATRTNTPSLPVHTATLTFVFPAPTATSTLPYPTLTSITPPTWTATVFEPPIESTSTNTPISPGSGSSQRILYFVIGMLLTVAIAGTLLYLLWVFRQLSRSR